MKQQLRLDKEYCGGLLVAKSYTTQMGLLILDCFIYLAMSSKIQVQRNRQETGLNKILGGGIHVVNAKNL